MLAAILVGCGPPAASVSSPSTAARSPGAEATASPPTASATTSASATAVPTETAMSSDSIAVDSLVEVIVTDLVVRSAPGVDAATSTILDGRLRFGDRAYVVAGPTEASGYDWYEVGPLMRADGSAAPFGWIASGSREGEAWVRAIEPECPSVVDIAPILDMQPLERLACYGDAQLALTAPFVSCGAGGGPISFDPAWLVNIGGCALALTTSGDSALAYRVPPDLSVPASPAGATTVVGHFDDPAAATCTATSADPGEPAPVPDEAVLICRTEFVAEGS
jgi:hypothetical protein